MTSQEFIYGAVIGVPVLVTAMSPILKLSANIVKLNASIESLTKEITTQGKLIIDLTKEINALKLDVANHNTRLDNLEQRSCKYEESKKYKGE
jgi:outer membrane murein-binding lipoprotein Lpp